MLETVRGLVRPTSIWAMIAAGIGFQAVHVYRGGSVEEWFVLLLGIMVKHYFDERTEIRRNNSQ